MPAPGRFYQAVARGYDFLLARALRAPWVVVGASLAAVVVGVLLYTGVPNPVAKREPGKPPPELVRGLETGLMPKMDEGAFILDYWAPSGCPLAERFSLARSPVPCGTRSNGSAATFLDYLHVLARSWTVPTERYGVCQHA